MLVYWVAQVRMVNHRLRLVGHQGHAQRQNHQLRRRALSERLAHHLAAVYIEDHGLVQESRLGRDVGHIRHPQLVDVSDRKLPAHQIRRRSVAQITLCGSVETAPPSHAPHRRLTHQSGNTLSGGQNACVLLFRADAWHAIRFITGD